MGKRFPGLDHLRAAAIILVFIFHYGTFSEHPDWIKSLGSFGWTGVDLFFVLSGFLIAGELFSRIREKKDLGLRLFYTKRFFRIIPVYLVVLACYFAIPGFAERPNLSPLWRYFTFTQNFGLDLREIHAFTHAWSLCVEEQFYLLLPLLLLLCIRLRILRVAPWLIGALFIGGFLIRYYSWMHFVQNSDTWTAWYEYIYYPTYNRLDGLLTGIGIAAVYQFLPLWRDRILSYGNLLLAVGLVAIAGAYFLFQDGQSLCATVFGFPLISAAYGCIVLAAISPSCFLHRYGNKVTGTIAALSYGIYLSHKAIIHLTQTLFSQWGLEADGTWMVIIAAVVCLLGALLLRFLVEKPAVRWRNKVIQTH